ncbi:LPS export ABC transporter permease LptF [Thalassotalea eurytherma]|uniref:Lipopolysaccharide export system permease protein LptF n=1 Tax=Thalassotalea eurytherma TaxID=1144278 RepID=A0ABQ6H259_9GAMM|nr:LPS export ABC transporter permease LptF [Thalassotalea eurytherma]GLX81652.1 LPS export ABC transporter permease LptF [Thalassotalea eurytherma]
MIIFRYLLSEVAKTQFAVFFILMTIFISQKFVRVLDDASEGGIPGHLVMIFIGLKVPDLAGTLLPLSLFLGILLAYGRIYAESEMTILHACGVSEWYVVRVTLVLGLITAVITGIFTLYLSPMAAEYEYQVKEELAADAGISSVVAGRFQKTSNNKAVMFVHNKDREGNQLDRVFVAQLPDENSSFNEIINSSIVYAKSGQVIEEESGAQKLILEDGVRYQKDTESKELRVVSFGNYAFDIQDKKVEHKRRKVTATPTVDLLGNPDPEAKAAIQWRVAFPISCLILTLIAVPLSVVNPRQGKFGKLVPALLLFLTYFLLLTSIRSGIESEAVPHYVGLWPIHLCALVLGVSLIVQGRTSGRKIKAKLPKVQLRGRNA